MAGWEGYGRLLASSRADHDWLRVREMTRVKEPAPIRCGHTSTGPLAGQSGVHARGSCSFCGHASQQCESREEHAKREKGLAALKRFSPQHESELIRDFKLFRQGAACQHATMTSGHTWSFHDCGPRNADLTVVFIPGLGGTCGQFYQQLTSLAAKGHRCISVRPPPYFSHAKWALGLIELFDYLNVRSAHLFGDGLGGFLSLGFAQRFPRYADSLIMCNSFSSNQAYDFTQYFLAAALGPLGAVLGSLLGASAFHLIPEMMLKHLLLAQMPRGRLPSRISDAVVFAIDQLETLSHDELVSQLVLHCAPSDLMLDAASLRAVDAITVMHTIDGCALPTALHDHLLLHLNSAKDAPIKRGRGFPCLAEPDEVTLHVQVHLERWRRLQSENM